MSVDTAQMETEVHLNGLHTHPNTTLHNQNEQANIEENGSISPSLDMEAGQISPSSRRRSTRASAIKAQEKIKMKEGYDQPFGENYVPQDGEEEGEETEEDEVAAKKRKLDNGSALNQFSHKFGIKLKEDGAVYMLSDESEISSLNDEDLDHIRKGYEKVLSRELTDEQKKERLLMIRRAEADLRLEEARLMMLKKMRHSQQHPNKAAEVQKKIAASVPQNSSGMAYKPPVAAPPVRGSNQQNATSSTGNKPKATPSSNASKNPILSIAGLTPQQQQEFLTRAAQINPVQAAQALLALTKGNLANIHSSPQAQIIAALLQAQQHQQKAAKAATAAATPSTSTPSVSTTAASVPGTSSSNNGANNPLAAFAAQTPQQRAAAARQTFRRNADQQLMRVAVPPKTPPHDFFFVPNPSQTDYCALLGLDLVVQRVLKDKAVFAPVTEGPYECEECGTDFTPSWRAIGTSEKDMHVYCDACVKGAQKKKIRTDHTNALRKVFATLEKQEKAFEQQIKDGKLDSTIVEVANANAKATQQAAANSAAMSAAAASSSQPQNLSIKNQMPSGSGTSTPQPTPKSATPVSHHGSAQKPSTSSNPSSSKRTATSSSSNNSNQSMQNVQQIAQFMQACRSNPVMAAALMNNPMMAQMMTNPSIMQQMMQMNQMGGGWNPMMMMAAAAQAQQQAQARMAAAQPNLAAAMLAHAAQAHSASSSASTSNAALNALAAAAGANPAAAMAQLAAQAAAGGGLSGINPALLSTLNPQLLRQMQQQMQQMGGIKAKK